MQKQLKDLFFYRVRKNKFTTDKKSEETAESKKN